MKKNKAPKTVAKSSIAVKNSKIHGRGVFVKKEIAKGSAIIEYIGERISWKEALRRHPHDPEQPNHTFISLWKMVGLLMQTLAAMRLAGLIIPVNQIARPTKSRLTGKAGSLFLQSAIFFPAKSFL